MTFHYLFGVCSWRNSLTSKQILFQAISGDELWKLLQEDGFFCPADLKLILKATKWDNLNTLSEMNSDSDLISIQNFMQNTLHLILPDSEREKYYSLFKDHPEKFQFVGGDIQMVKQMIEHAKNISRKHNNKRPFSSGSVKTTGVTPAEGGSNTANEAKKSKSVSSSEILKAKKTLEDTINIYANANFPLLKDKTVECIVACDGYNSFVAKAPCPVDKCTEIRKVTRNDKRWNTSNYYAHIRSHFSKRKSKISDSKCMKINKMLSQQKSKNKCTDSDSENEDDPERGNVSMPLLLIKFISLVYLFAKTLLTLSRCRPLKTMDKI